MSDARADDDPRDARVTIAVRYGRVVLPRIARFVERIEAVRAPGVAWAVALLCVIMVRALVELALEYPTATMLRIWIDGGGPTAGANLTGGSDDAALLVLHWPGFYLTIFFGLALVLSWLGGAPVARTSKAIVLGFPILWLPPIVDAALTGGRGTMLEYNLQRDFGTLLATFYDPRADVPGVSAGIRIEIFLASIGGALYVLGKGRGVVRAAVAFVAVTLVPAAVGSWPGWVGRATLVPHDYPGTLHGRLGVVYLVLVLGLGAWWAWRADPARFRAARSNLRGPRTAHYVAMAVLGYVIAELELPGARTPAFEVVVPLVGVALAVACAFQFNVQINDLVDRDVDATSNRERPLATGRLTQTDVVWLAGLYGVASVAFAAAVGTPVLLLVLAYNALGLLYSAPPFRLRRVFPLATLVLAGCSLVAMIAGFAVVAGGNALVFFPRRTALLLAVTFVAAFTFKDVKDVEGDRAAGDRTLPVLLGPTRGRWVVAALMLAAYTSVPLLVGRGGILWIAPAVGVATAALIVRGDRPNEPLLFALYFGFAALATVVLVRTPHAPAFRPANLGYHHLLAGDPAAARAAFAADPGLSPYERDVGIALVHTLDGDTAAAIEHAARAAARAPGDTSAQLLHAYTLAAGGRAGDAEAVFRAIVARDPRAAGARFNLGNLAFERGEHDVAIEHYRRALAERPDWGEARFNLGNGLLKRRDAAGAEVEYRRALRLVRPSAHLHNNLGLALEQQGRTAEARTEFTRALALDPAFELARRNRDRLDAR